ncbi:MAG TPA: DedA family protein [Gemmatimonadaceae bacterium]|nr:DedA family protein [Gemmatimonadaceae bacterium]
MEQFITNLVSSYGYAIVFVIVGIESLGIPLPGETALLAAAAFAAVGDLNIYLVVALAAAGAILGDNAGYWIGRKGGLPFVHRYGRVLHISTRKINRVHRFFDRYGPKTVFFGRFIALLRTWAAVLAGTARMPYGQFMLYNAAGGVAWSVLIGALGYLFGEHLSAVKHYLRGITIAVVVILLAVGGVYLWRHHHRRRAVKHGAR